jgi:hypothetical protein
MVISGYTIFNCLQQLRTCYNCFSRIFISDEEIQLKIITTIYIKENVPTVHIIISVKISEIIFRIKSKAKGVIWKVRFGSLFNDTAAKFCYYLMIV